MSLVFFVICLFLFVVFQIYSVVEETLGGHRTQDTENQLFGILSVSVSEFDIMVLSMITVAATAVTSLLTVYFLGKESSGSDFGREVQTNSRIEHEQNQSITSSFHYYAKKLQINNENEMLHLPVPTEMVLPVPTEVEDKEVVQLPVSREMVLPVPIEVEDKEVVQLPVSKEMVLSVPTEV